MQTFKQMYTHLFNAITYSLDLLAQENPAAAAARLMEAQRETEAMYMDTENGEAGCKHLPV